MASSLVFLVLCTGSSGGPSGGIALTQKAFPNVRDAAGELVQPWKGSTARDLHQEYNNIFKYGNRNAASHLWATFLFDRSVFLTERTFLDVAAGFCAVSGSPVSARPGTRYKMRLQKVDGSGREEGFMYYCCWPCVCDTQDFIRADTKTIRTSDRGEQTYSVVVIGNPCDHPEKLTEPFIQPFDKRSTTIAQDAREVRCSADGHLIGATLSDHGYIILGMFFNTSSVPATEGFQDEDKFVDHCEDRKQNGYNSGMGEIFRRVAAISPIYPGAIAGGAGEAYAEVGGATPAADAAAGKDGSDGVNTVNADQDQAADSNGNHDEF